MAVSDIDAWKKQGCNWAARLQRSKESRRETKQNLEIHSA